MISWHKKEEEHSRERAIERGGQERDTLETTTGQGGEWVHEGERLIGLITAAQGARTVVWVQPPPNCRILGFHVRIIALGRDWFSARKAHPSARSYQHGHTSPTSHVP